MAVPAIFVPRISRGNSAGLSKIWMSTASAIIKLFTQDFSQSKTTVRWLLAKPQLCPSMGHFYEWNITFWTIVSRVNICNTSVPVGLKSDGMTERRDTWRSICHGPLTRRCLRVTDTWRFTGPCRCSSDGTDDEIRLIVHLYEWIKLSTAGKVNWTKTKLFSLKRSTVLQKNCATTVG